MENELTPRSEALRFPRGVRLAREADLPKNKTRNEQLARIASATITTGFVTKLTTDPGFSAYIEVNAHADELWQVFETLASILLPETAAPLIGWKDQDPSLGHYTDKSAALAVLRSYAEILQHDGFIQFGAMFQSEGKTEEVFVKASKDIQLWTNRPEVAEQALISMRIPKVGKLQFVDEFPMVTERLEGNPSSEETISNIVRAFGALPPR
jgi:hypothetical protein